MATEFKLSYTGSQINEKLNKIDNLVSTTEQSLTDDQKTQARQNIGAVSMEEVEELLGIEEEFSVTGELVEFDVDVEPGTELEVISKIHRDETWGLSNKLVLHHVSGTNFVDFSSYLGGAGTVFEKNGLTAIVNADSTITIRGTNESDAYTYIINKYWWSGEHSEKVYPAGTYRIPSGFVMAIRAAQYPTNVVIPGFGNLSNTVTIPEPFRIIMMQYGAKAGTTVDVTLPLGLFRGSAIPETGYEYSGNIYTATFDTPVYEGEFNWRTGELKDADGNTVGYYDVPEIKCLPGTNYFWTCFGENTVSNRKDDGKVVLRLNETAPEDTIPSICDFMLTPTTPEAAYGLYYAPFLPNGQFAGNEVPVMTTKGTLAVKDADGNVKYSKYIEPMFNARSVSDVLTHKGLEKKWSKKFYLNKEPISITMGSSKWDDDQVPYVFVWEFDESEFANTGIPAKIHDIPTASPCFINNDNSENNINTQVLWNGTPYPAFFSYDVDTGKYTLTMRGIQGGRINAQLTLYSKVHFYYQLETPYTLPFNFAMGIDAGDMITFEVDLEDNQPYIDVISEFKNRSVTPSITAFIPRNVEDAMDGMNNAARILNADNTAGGDATVQGYSWIGEGDGSTDYTVQIQSKLDELHIVSKGGIINLGPGTYPISKSLIIYGNTTIVGCGVKTTIMQTVDNTDAIVASGSNITLKDFCIHLGGACTELTGCVYINSNNPNGENGYPSNYYAQSITIENISMSGNYKFEYADGRPILGDVYNNYKGVGIYDSSMYFNYAHIDNVYFGNLMSGVYGGGGSNYFNITAVSCKYGVYASYARNNTFFINGHSYYDNDEDGTHISMSDAMVYAEDTHMCNFYLVSYDSQAYKMYAFLGPTCHSNKIDIQNSYSTHNGSGISGHDWNILKHHILDYGRANVYRDIYKNTPFHIGSYTTSISKGPQLELSSPVIQNVLSGAGIWGNISSNTEFENKGIALRDVCRYPSEKTTLSSLLPYILSTVAPSVDNPIEIVIDYSNRPVIGIPNYIIQFHHLNVASDFVVSFDTTNTGVYDYEIPVSDNINIVMVNNYPQVGGQFVTYRMKITFTKALQIADFNEAMTDNTFNYNPDGLIGICNIGMTVNDYAGRSFLGECGGSLYGNVDMHQNTLKNLPNPVDDGDAVSKSYLEARLDEQLQNSSSSGGTLVDEVTGITYILKVRDGKLMMEVV